MTAASIFAGRGRKIDALKQYEALANESQKPALKGESAVRGGVIALELVQADKGKTDKAMADRATALLQKGRALPEDRKSTRLNSSHSQISYAVFCLKKKAS